MRRSLKSGLLSLLAAGELILPLGCSRENHSQNMSSECWPKQQIESDKELEKPKAVEILGDSEESTIASQKFQRSYRLYFDYPHLHPYYQEYGQKFGIGVYSPDDSDLNSDLVNSFWSREKSKFYLVSSQPLANLEIVSQEAVQLTEVNALNDISKLVNRPGAIRPIVYINTSARACIPKRIEEISGKEKRRILGIARENGNFSDRLGQDARVYLIPIDSPMDTNTPMNYRIKETGEKEITRVDRVLTKTTFSYDELNRGQALIFYEIVLLSLTNGEGDETDIKTFCYSHVALDSAY